MHAQNLSNAEQRLSTKRASGELVVGTTHTAEDEVAGEPDIQGVANALQYHASMLHPHFLVFSRIREVVVTALAAGAPVHSPGYKSPRLFFDVARYANHLCQLVWSFCFASSLDDELGA